MIEILTQQYKSKLFFCELGIHSDCQNFEIMFGKRSKIGVNLSGKGAIIYASFCMLETLKILSDLKSLNQELGNFLPSKSSYTRT